MSGSFVKWIDYSLVPFCFLVLGKLLGLYIVISNLGIEWGVADFIGSFFSATPLVYGRDIQVVSTYSDVIMFGLIFVGTALQVFLLITRNHIQLTGKVKEVLIWANFDIWQETGAARQKLNVWLAYLMVAVLVIFFDFMALKVPFWLLTTAVLLTVMLVAAIDTAGKELEREIKQTNKYDFTL